jgi:hypothetical protein
MALPAVRARARGGISPSTCSRDLRIFMTASVGLTGSDEQGRDYRMRPDSAGASAAKCLITFDRGRFWTAFLHCA